MRSSKPPALATWLVEHLVPGGKNEALTGDLMEQFRQGRSAAWYWRQVFGAILAGCTKELCILWMAIGVTAIWMLAVAQFHGSYWFLAEFRWTDFWAIQHGYMTPSRSTGWFIALNALLFALAVGMYLRLARTFSVRRFLRGLSAGLLMIGIGYYYLGFYVRLTRWLWHHQTFVGYVVAALPVFFALMLSMLVARPNSAERRKMQRAVA